MTDWRTYIVFHRNLVDEYYQVDPLFNNQNYHFLKTNEAIKANYSRDRDYHVISEWQLGDFYNPELQQRTYMAPSAIYHIYKNDLHKKFKAIVFLEYDMVLNRDFTKRNNEIVAKHPEFITPFSYQHKLSNMYKQKDMLIRHKNAIEMIFKDYNDFFGTTYTPEPYLDTLIVSQQSFMCDRETFERIMKFITVIIETKRCEAAGSKPRPSALLDRYFAIALLLDKSPIIANPLTHKSHHQW